MENAEKWERLKTLIEWECERIDPDMCDECSFYNKYDSRDYEYFCMIRDDRGRIPVDDGFDLKAAILKWYT